MSEHAKITQFTVRHGINSRGISAIQVNLENGTSSDFFGLDDKNHQNDYSNTAILKVKNKVESIRTRRYAPNAENCSIMNIQFKVSTDAEEVESLP